MFNEFDEKTCQELKAYVYMLIDPRDVHILAQPEHPFCSNLNTYSETS